MTSETSREGIDSHAFWPLLVLLSIWTAACWCTMGTGYFVTGDDARMILEARALADNGVWPHHKQHLGMVAILSILRYVPLMYIFVGLCHVGLSLLAMKVIEKWVDSRWLGAVGGVMFALSAGLGFWSGQIMTEIPFLYFTFLSILLYQRGWIKTALVLAVATITIRDVGIVLLFSLLWDMVRRRMTFLGTVAICAAIFGAVAFVRPFIWAKVSKALLGGAGIADYSLFWDLPFKIIANIGLVFNQYLYEMIFPTIYAGFEVVELRTIYVVMFFFMIIGVAMVRDRLFTVFSLATLASLIFWNPTTIGARYIIPLVPIAIVSICSLAKHYRKTGLTLIGIFLAVNIVTTHSRFMDGPYYPKGWKSYSKVAKEIDEIIEEPAKIMVRKMNMFRLASDKHTFVWMGRRSSVDRVNAALKSANVDYIVIDNTDYNTAVRDWYGPLLKSDWTKFYRYHDCVIYKRPE